MSRVKAASLLCVIILSIGSIIPSFLTITTSASTSTSEQLPSYPRQNTTATGFVGGDMVKLYEKSGKPLQGSIWTRSDSFAQQISKENSIFNFSQSVSKTSLFQGLNNSCALLIMKASKETNPEQLTEKEVSIILD